MKKTTTFARKRANFAKLCKRDRAQLTPIGRLYKRENAEEGFKSLILTTRIKILTMDDGSDATEMLASLAVVIGTVCQAGSNQYKAEKPPWVRQLHGALRTVQDMCLNGYLWQAQYAAAMERAVEIASEDRPDMDARIFFEAWDKAVGFADVIWAHQVEAGAVAA
jgi:hypothetical protein